MADFSDVAALRENETVMRRVAVAMVAGTRSMLTASPLDPAHVHFAQQVAADPRHAGDRYFFVVMTSAALLARMTAGTLAATTDAELTASVAEVAPGLAAP